MEAVSDVGPCQTIYWKIRYADAELTGHVYKLDVKLQILCGSSFSLFAVCILAKSYHFGTNWPTTLRKQRLGIYIPWPLNLNATIALTSYDCVIPQMAILYDAMKTIQNGVLVFFFK